MGGFLGPSGEETYEDSVDSITTKNPSNPFDKNPNFETKNEEKEKRERKIRTL